MFSSFCEDCDCRTCADIGDCQMCDCDSCQERPCLKRCDEYRPRLEDDSEEKFSDK